MGKELTGFEQFLQLVKDEHERQNKEADDLEKRLSAIEENLGKLKDVVEKITRLSFVAQTIQKIEGARKEREFPKTFQEVLNILKTNAKNDYVDFLYLLWNGIMNNQAAVSQRAITQELATLKCMLITKAINMVDDLDGSRVHYLYFYLGYSYINDCYVDSGGSQSTPFTLTFMSKEGADHALKYFREEWKQMYAKSK